MQTLPIDAVIPGILAALARASAVVVEAPPGAGKTTRVPLEIFKAGLAGGGDVVVLQPRRLPTRLAATRVAAEICEPVGKTVGYAVRFEDVTSAATRVRYVTEGILTHRLIEDPLLTGTGVVVLDEFHERHIATDLGLALLRRLQRSRRPDLKIVVMSATLDAGPIAAWLGDAPRVRSEGRLFDVKIDFLARPPDRRPVFDLAAAACRDLVREEPSGDILVFLPGAGEIAKALDTLGPFAREQDLLVLPLHGNMTLDAQHRAVTPADRRKIILSTNVAETSVTIEGVTAVVDAGLARVAGHSPWSGLPTLALAKVSRASAVQRAGRAGRTRPGRALRLYTKEDFDARPAHDTPEILRADLAETLLALHAAVATDPGAFEWLDAPPAQAIDAAEDLLRRLGALDDAGAITGTGRRIARFPIHPRLARIIVEGESRGVAADACAVAALASERDIRLESRVGGGPRGAGGKRGGDSDLLEMLDQLKEAGDDPQRARRHGLDLRAVETVSRATAQLRRLCRPNSPTPHTPDLIPRTSGLGPASSDLGPEQALLLSILTGFPDRVARRRVRGGRDLVLSSGGSAELGAHSVVHDAAFMTTIDVENRSGGGASGTVVRTASGIEPEWLLDLYPSEIRETDEPVWNAAASRVEAIRKMSYGAIALTESRGPATPSPEVSRLLAKQALAHGISAFDPDDALSQLAARVAMVRTHFPDLALPDLRPGDALSILEAASEGLKSFAELKEVRLDERLAASLAPPQANALRTHAPLKLTLPGGRSVPVNYEAGKPPWVESHLQDFFGMAATPTVCAGRVAIVVHLLAPSRRPVQVTADLAGFWKNHYPAIRRELSRKYPRHLWPEDGATAKPPPPRRPRR